MIDNQFEVNKLIGNGGSSHVFSATDLNGESCAIKIIRKDKNYTSEMAQHLILREYFVMERVGNHPNIVKSIMCSTEGQITRQDEIVDIMYHVLELCKNGSLCDFVKYTGAVEENFARFHFLQIASAVHHMHSLGFVHLDIKLDNILLDEFFNAKLADLGFSRCITNTHGLTNIKVGTPNYIAPEVQDLETNCYYNGAKADVYSLGILLYVLLVGTFPNSTSQMKANYSNESISTKSNSSNDQNMSYTLWFNDEKLNQNMSEEAQDLISKMIANDPNERITIEQVLQHPFLAREFDQSLPSLVFQEFEARRNYMHSNSNSQTFGMNDF